MIAGKNQRDFEFVISLLCLERVVGVYREREGVERYTWSLRGAFVLGKVSVVGPTGLNKQVFILFFNCF